MKYTLLSVLFASQVYAGGFLESGKMAAYEALHKPKSEAGATNKIIIKNWGNDWVKGTLYRTANPDERKQVDARSFPTHRFEIAPGDAFEYSKSTRLPLTYLALRSKGGKFDLDKAKNNAWQDLTLDGNKVDGVRIWVSMRDK